MRIVYDGRGLVGVRALSPRTLAAAVACAVDDVSFRADAYAGVAA